PRPRPARRPDRHPDGRARSSRPRPGVRPPIARDAPETMTRPSRPVPVVHHSDTSVRYTDPAHMDPLAGRNAAIRTATVGKPGRKGYAGADSARASGAGS